MRANYDQLVKAHQQAPHIQEDIVPDEVKFQVKKIVKNVLSNVLICDERYKKCNNEKYCFNMIFAEIILFIILQE